MLAFNELYQSDAYGHIDMACIADLGAFSAQAILPKNALEPEQGRKS